MLVLIKQDTHLTLSVIDSNYPLKHIKDSTVSNWTLDDTVWIELEITGELQLAITKYVAANTAVSSNIFITS